MTERNKNVFSFSYNFDIRHLVAREFFSNFRSVHSTHLYIYALNNYTQENKNIIELPFS